MFAEFLADVSSGHAIKASVFEECHSMYRASGPIELRSLGETEFATGVAAMSASGEFGPARVCAGIVGNIDMMLGASVDRVLDLHIAAGGGRFAGVRYSTAWHPSDLVPKVASEPHLLADARVREGIACLARKGLTFDAWVYHHQIDEVTGIAEAFPDLPIVLCHFGTPILGGPNAGRQSEVFKEWRQSMSALARHPNVYVKLGALPVRRTVTSPGVAKTPLSSMDIAAGWRPWVDVCIDLFGADRCMFESNFPVQKRWCSYPIVWNACKRLAQSASAAEKTSLFSGVAARVYRLPVALC